MSEPTASGFARGRAVLFGVCAVCPTWLIVQNLALATLLPWHHVTGLDAVERALDRIPWPVALPFVSTPIAFVLGWTIARSVERPRKRRMS